MSPESRTIARSSPNDDAIWVESLVKYYPRAAEPALDNFTLHVKRGEFFGLLGPNGAGKTTALSIVSGFMTPDSGTVEVLGERLYPNLRKIKPRIGLVPQELALYENLTAMENLLFFGRFYGLHGDRLHSEIRRCLKFTELQDQAGKRVSAFSGGMKRRLNLSAGILHNPRILFLDEPTVGIDAQSRNLIHQRLTELNRAGTTLIYTTHYMEEAEELCSQVGIIDNGTLLLQGRPAELTRSGGFKNLNDLFFSLTGKKLRDA
jgi:ABC-2 type transport system ATP-binding protein